MAHNRTTQYSAPYRRNNVLGLHQYAASEHFPSLGKWDRARTEDLYVVRGTAARTQPVQIIVVGAISSDKAFLKPHGNYDPSYMPFDQIGKKAKLQFVLTSPEEDPDFLADYNLALQRFRAIQDEVAGSSFRREHFLEGNNLKMNFYLFQEKEEPLQSDVDGDRSSNEEESEDEPEIQTPTPAPERPEYEVTSTYKSIWESVGETYDNCIMEVYGANERPVDYRQFDKRLRAGTIVMVTFTLKHFAIRDKGSSQIVSDTYSAVVQSVSILKDAEKPKRRSAIPASNRRPLPVSQLAPPSRATLQLAADAFAPVKQREAHVSTSIVDENSPPAFDGILDTREPPTQIPNDLHTRVGILTPSRSPNFMAPLSTLSHSPPVLMDQLVPYILERIKQSASGMSRQCKSRKTKPVPVNFAAIPESPLINSGELSLSTNIIADNSSCSSDTMLPSTSIDDDFYSSDLTEDSIPELEPVSDDDMYLAAEPSEAVGMAAATSGTAVEDDSSWVEVPSVILPGINPDCDAEKKEGSIKQASPETLQTDVLKRESDLDGEVVTDSAEKNAIKTPTRKARCSKKRKA